MGNDIVLDVCKQAYLLGNEQTRRVFESLPFRHNLKVNREIWKCVHVVCTKTGDFDFTFLAIPRRPRSVETWNLPHCRF